MCTTTVHVHVLYTYCTVHVLHLWEIIKIKGSTACVHVSTTAETVAVILLSSSGGVSKERFWNRKLES